MANRSRTVKQEAGSDYSLPASSRPSILQPSTGSSIFGTLADPPSTPQAHTTKRTRATAKIGDATPTQATVRAEQPTFAEMMAVSPACESAHSIPRSAYQAQPCEKKLLALTGRTNSSSSAKSSVGCGRRICPKPETRQVSFPSTLESRVSSLLS